VIKLGLKMWPSILAALAFRAFRLLSLALVLQWSESSLCHGTRCSTRTLEIPPRLLARDGTTMDLSRFTAP